MKTLKTLKTSTTLITHEGFYEDIKGKVWRFSPIRNDGTHVVLFLQYTDAVSIIVKAHDGSPLGNNDVQIVKYLDPVDFPQYYL